METLNLIQGESDASVNNLDSRRARRRVWIRAMFGELIASIMFFLCVMGVALNMRRLGEDHSSAVIANALASAFSAIAVV